MDKKLQRLVEPGFRLYFIILFIFTAAVFFVSRILFAIMLLVAMGLFVYYRSAMVKRQKTLEKYIQENTVNTENLSGSMLLSFPLPMTVVKVEDGSILWANDNFADMVGTSHLFERNINDLIGNMVLNWVTEGGASSPVDAVVGERTYSVKGNLFRTETAGLRGLMAVLYFVDKTDVTTGARIIQEERIVIADIIWDNYEEMAKNNSDSSRSSLSALLDRMLSDWASTSGGLMRRSDRDRYMFIFREKGYEQYAADNFNILDKTMEIVSESGMPVTLSIGVGRGGETLEETYRFARLASEMALSRGGNQAVVRTEGNFQFYGGHTIEMEKRSQVRSRIMSNVLDGLIRDSSNVLIMSHKGADPDSIGAAAGVACAARALGREFHIIVDQSRCTCMRIIESLKETGPYEKAFIDAETALVIGNSRSLLVVVDTSRKEYVESPQLIESFNRIAVIDHHRRPADYIENAAVYIQETTASSTCEILCEMLQYIVPTNSISKAEADALLAGIMLDTRNFSIKTGVRAFEAAAYLRRVGADTIEVKRYFQGGYEEFIKKTSLVAQAKYYRDTFLIVASDTDEDRAVAARAADSLLDVSGVTASFVLFKNEGEVCISGRSLGQVNVQLILEWMGGGGQLTSAGAQLSNKSIDEVYRQLCESIDRYMDNNGKKTGKA